MAVDRSRKATAAGLDAAEQELRDQEVLRANRELAAYFRGRRTEREARAALKIIKAFIRDRARIEPKKRRPLPGKRKAPNILRERRQFAGWASVQRLAASTTDKPAAAPPRE